MIDPAHDLSITKQASALGISRGSVYYLPRPVSDRDQALMRKMGIEALYRKPRTTKRHPEHRVLAVTRPNQVWAMDTSFCLDALEEALERYGTPGIMNTDQGSQFTRLARQRLWRTVKYEHVYLHAYDTTSDAKEQLKSYFDFYNRRRPHSRLGDRTPDMIYFESLPVTQAA